MADDTKYTSTDVEMAREALSIMEEQLKVKEKLLEDENFVIEYKQKELELSNAILQDSKKHIADLVKKKQLGQELSDLEKKQLQDLKQQVKEHSFIVSLLEKEAKFRQDINDKVGNFFNLTLGIKKDTETLLGKFGEWNKQFKLLNENGLEFRDVLGEIKKSSSSYLNILSISSSILSKIVESTLMVAAAQDRAVSSLNRLLGGTGEYTDMVTSLTVENRQFAISMEESADVVSNLVRGMNSFTQESTTTQKAIADTTAELHRLGIDSAITAKNMNIATRSLGMTATQAEDLQRELFATATALKLPPETVAEAFASAGPKLAQHGKNMVNVFKQLAKQSKETGIEINNLIGIVSKMDTFEGAADVAGNLNAILGGDLLNSIDLLNASEGERIKMIQQSITLSGRQWHEMNRFEKMAVANAAGINDMAEAAAIFNPLMIGMSEAEIKAAKSKKELAERAKHVTSMTEQMHSVMASFAIIVTPLISVVKSLVDGLLWLNDAVTVNIFGFKTGLVTAVLGVASVIGILYKALTMVGIVSKSTGDKLGSGLGRAAQKTLQGFAVGVRSVGAAATQTGVGLMALGGSILLIGAGIGIAAYGIGEMAKGFAKLDAAQIIGVTLSLGILTGGLVAMASIMTTMSVPMGVGIALMLGFGAAVMMVGGGIGLISLGLSNIVSTMTTFNQSLANIKFDSVVSGYARVGAEISNIISEIEKMPLTKAVALSLITGATSELATPSAPPGANNRGVERVRASAFASGGTNQNSGNTVVLQPVKLVIDGREIGRILDPTVKNKIKEYQNVVGAKVERTPLE